MLNRKRGTVLLLVIFALQAPVQLRAQQNPQPGSLYFADPTILAYKGKYYLYGTDGFNSDSGFHVMYSDNLFRWRKANEGNLILKRGENFGTRGFWAPHVFELNDRLCIAYTANENIAIAWADHPAQAFTQKVMMPLPAPVKQIDPFVFRDQDGRLYLYHVRLQNGNRIFGAVLKPDMSGIIDSTLRECISADVDPQAWENTTHSEWPVTEGPTVIKIGHQYVLFYAANDFRNPDYAVGYAVAEHPLGPYKKATNGPVINRQLTGQNGSGHGDIVTDTLGNIYYVFHTHFSGLKVAPRRTAIIRLKIQESSAGQIEVQADKKSFRFLTTD